MALKLPRLCLLLLLFSVSWAQGHGCQRFNSSCDECIMSGPDCAWCSAPNAKVRCHTLEELQNSGCTDVYNPQWKVEFLRNEDRPARIKTVFMQPQQLSIYLRPGQAQTIQLGVFMPKDQQNTHVMLETVDKPAGMTFTLSSNITGTGLIEVTVNAAQCPSRNQNMTGPWVAYVKSKDSLHRVKLQVYLECHCSCSLTREEKSAACSGRGAHVCGHCECDQSYVGENCQMKDDDFYVRDENGCRSHENAPLCSGQGTCDHGECVCDKLIDPNHRYSGRYCECGNFHCPYSNNRICGGNGFCSCNLCICKRDWTGEACDCSLDVKACMATNGQICNGRGSCDCGTCKCHSRFIGPTCEDCPTCPGSCTRHRGCVECRAFGRGEMASRCDTECNDFSLTMVDTKDQLHEMSDIHTTGYCKERSEDDCFFYFAHTKTSSGTNVTAVRARDCN
ncbi:unnamed protein product [Ophioblennius macclurei]